MSDLDTSGRRQVLILVEGKHEKEILLKMLLRCFPEIPVKQENIHIYETDVYDLYNRIEKEYGADWDEQDVDIPWIISVRNQIVPPLDGRKFTDVLLMFDFERHDNLYSDERIRRLQQYFSATGENGNLYINYPMIEAYQHMAAIPDPSYLTKSAPKSFGEHVTYGQEYKAQVKRESYILRYLDFYEQCLREVSQKMLCAQDGDCEAVLFQILALSNNSSLIEDIDNVLAEKEITEDNRNNLKYLLRAKIARLGYTAEGKSFWEKMRELFICVINQNIEKSWYIQNGLRDGTYTDLHEVYNTIDWSRVLNQQIIFSSQEQNARIWVLCSCITFLGEYKFFWKKQ